MAAAPAVPAALAAVLLLVAVAVPLAVLAGRAVLAVAVTRSVAAAAATARAVEVSVRLDRTDPARQDAVVRRHLSEALRGSGSRVVAVHRGELLAPVSGVTGDARLVPWSSPGLAGRARLAGGRWPAPGAAGAVETAVQADAAAAAGLTVGSRLRFGAPAAGERQLPDLVVVGLWRAADPADAAWFASPLELSGSERPGVYGPAAVDPADEARIPVTWTARWRAVPDPARITPSALPGLAARVGALPGRLADVPTAGAAAATLDGFLAATLAGQRDLRDRAVGAIAVLLSAPAALGAAALLLAAALLVELRAGDDRVLRVRGAGPGRRARTALAEPLLLAAPVAALAVPVAGWAAARPVGTAGALPAVTVVVTVLAVVAPAVLLLAAAVQLGLRARFRALGAARAGAASGAAEQAQAGRTGRVLSGLALLAVVALAGWQLDRSGVVVSRGVDPVLLAAPLALLVAAGVLLVRGLRVGLAPAAVLARGRRLGPALLGRRLSRSAVRPVAPVVALLVAVAAAVCAVAARDEADRALRAQALLTLGAEQVATVPPAPGSGAAVPDGTAQAGVVSAQVRAGLLRVPGVRAVSPVRRSAGTAGGRQVELLGADTAALAGINAAARAAAGSPAGVGALPARLLAPLAALQREPGGLPLPPGTTALALTGRVVTQSFGAGSLSGVRLQVQAVLAGPDGQPVRVPFRALPTDAGSGTVTAELPAGTAADAVRLVGLDLTAPVLPTIGALSLLLDRAVAVTGQGRSELPAPRTWVPADAGLPGTADGSGSSQGARVLGLWLNADVLVSPGAGAPTAVRVAADPAPAPVLPALVERRLAAGLGLSPGDRFSVDRGGRSVELKVSAVLDRLPGKGSGSVDGVLVDLGTLARADVAAAGQAGAAPAPREWWVTGGARPAALVAALEPLRDQGSGPPGLRVMTADLAGRRADPWVAGPVALLRLLPWLLAAGVLVALALGAVVSARGRRDEVAGLVAVGASRRQVGRWVAAEQLVVGWLVVLLGGLLGATAARLVVPVLTAPVLGDDPGLGAALRSGPAGLPPLPAAATSAVLAGAALLVLLAALLQARAARRVPVARVLREGAR